MSSCSKYALSIADTEQEIGELRFRVREGYSTLVPKVQNWLRSRRRLENVVRSNSETFKVYFITPWVRESSLRFYQLDFDRRKRHISEWKAQWMIKSISSNESLIEIKVMEVIFMGPTEAAGPLPDIRTGRLTSMSSSDWFETDPDHLRAVVEARRFWNESYPLAPLPKEIANVNVPALESEPWSKSRDRKPWKSLARPKLF